MSWSGGSYTKGNAATGGWAGDASLGIGIEAGRHDTQDNDFATGINNCLAKDGQNAMTANINLGGYIPTNVGAGTAAAPAYCAGNDSNTGMFSPAADNIGFATNGSERVRIDNTGKVGIGASPTNNLTVGDGTGTKSIVANGANSGTAGGSYIASYVAGSTKVAIGNYSAIFGGAYDGAPLLYFSGGTPRVTGIVGGVGDRFMKWNTANAEWTFDTSSARFKENIVDSQYGLQAVLALRSVEFDYKEAAGRHDVGFIAEEVLNVVPEVVGLDKEGLPEAVMYDRLTSVLCKAIQELNAKVDALEARVAVLEA